MFKKILFPTDFSEGATKALEYIKRLKDCGAEEIFLLTIGEDNYWDVMADNPKLAERLIKESTKKAQKNLERTALELFNRGLKVKQKVMIGTNWRNILENAQKEDISLIVLGSLGQNFLKRLLWRLDLKVVIKKAKQPLLIITKNI